MELIFIDTSAFYALANRADRHHGEAARIIGEIEERGARPFTSNFVVAETHALILARRGHASARQWLGRLAIPVEQASRDDQLRAVNIVLEQTDKTYSLVDAISFAMMRRMGVNRAFAFDRHFEQHGYVMERSRS